MATEPSNNLYGSCACERNQYTVIVPTNQAQQAQVFFDNTASTRRPLASPVTAWLRIPLTWYNSTTYALFPDESHTSIKKTFYAPNISPLPPTRRQFCGYCGTHLTAWNEPRTAEFLDVTLGSLLAESLERLEELRILPGGGEDGEDEEGEVGREIAGAPDYAALGGLRGDGAEVKREEHVGHQGDVGEIERRGQLHRLTGRGWPYFEELVQDSGLGRLRRQRGGGVSADGSTVVQWEVVEIGGDEDETMAEGPTTVAGVKRARQES